MDEKLAQFQTLAELCKSARLSAATIHRLKKAGKLPYLQPSGKGGKLLFPVNAVSLVAEMATTMPQSSAAEHRDHGHRLSGPLPKWERELPQSK